MFWNSSQCTVSPTFLFPLLFHLSSSWDSRGIFGYVLLEMCAVCEFLWVFIHVLDAAQKFLRPRWGEWGWVSAFLCVLILLKETWAGAFSFPSLLLHLQIVWGQLLWVFTFFGGLGFLQIMVVCSHLKKWLKAALWPQNFPLIRHQSCAAKRKVLEILTFFHSWHLLKRCLR